MEMTPTQLTGMIKFHTRTEKAYRNAGKIDMAEAAKTKREELAKKHDACSECGGKFLHKEDCSCNGDFWV